MLAFLMSFFLDLQRWLGRLFLHRKFICDVLEIEIVDMWLEAMKGAFDMDMK